MRLLSFIISSGGLLLALLLTNLQLFNFLDEIELFGVFLLEFLQFDSVHKHILHLRVGLADHSLVEEVSLGTAVVNLPSSTDNPHQ